MTSPAKCMSEPTSEPCPTWIIDALRDGFRLLLSLSLEGTPSHSTIAATAMGWAHVLCAHGILDEQRDRPRFAEAFTTLAGSCRRWPAPVDFMAALPRTQSPSRATKRREPDDAERARTAKHIAELLQSINHRSADEPSPDEAAEKSARPNALG